MLNLRDYLRFNTTLIFIDKFGSYPKYPLKRKHDKRSWNNVKRVKTMSNLTGKTVNFCKSPPPEKIHYLLKNTNKNKDLKHQFFNEIYDFCRVLYNFCDVLGNLLKL